MRLAPLLAVALNGGGIPGRAWASALTPMTDFPVMNANAHAMPLLALFATSVP